MYNKQQDYGVKYTGVAVENFRDLGGITVGNGRVIVHDKIFRSGALSETSAETMSALEKLQIGHIFDFRGLDEAEYKPDCVPTGCKYHNVPALVGGGSMIVNPSRIADMIPSVLPASVSCWCYKLRFKHIYRKLPFKNKAYAEMFQIMDCGDSFLFHCSAGKDRTGVASMLILLALGADFETAKKDYMLSNYYRADCNEEFYRQFEVCKNYKKIKTVLETACNVDVEMLEIAYNAIIKKYKTFANYLQKEYGADEKRVENWIKNYTEQTE